MLAVAAAEAGVLHQPNLILANGVATAIPLVGLVEVPPTLGTWSLLTCNVVEVMVLAEVAHLEMLAKVAVEVPTMELLTGDSSLLHSLQQLLDLQVRFFLKIVKNIKIIKSISFRSFTLERHAKQQ